MSTDDLRAIELLHRVRYGRVATTMRAMPFVAPARHIVTDDSVVLRMHRGMGYHRACSGSVIAYGADNFNSGERDLWSVQCTGTASMIRPTSDELALFGPGPHRVDGEPFEPVYMSLTPQFATVHVLEYSTEQEPEREPEHDPEREPGHSTAPSGSRSGARHDRHAA
ncbi:pyridoxamine 5'-phosphate oxidase family protein [Streptomyces sp. NPDC050433]|uniref:pyridoxamine 5'-phosphate oxidase family protein n=1 Tax=unclassified Streptomyces TaxID=2593676 RepID=UPI003433A103